MERVRSVDAQHDSHGWMDRSSPRSSSGRPVIAEQRGLLRVPWKPVALFLLVALLVFLVALGANRPPTFDVLVCWSIDVRWGIGVLLLVLAVSFILAFGALVAVLFGGVGRAEGQRTQHRLSRRAKIVAGVLVAVYVAGWVAVLLLGRLDIVDRPAPLSISPSSPGEGMPADKDTTSLALPWWAPTIAALLVLAVPVLAVLLRQRREMWRRARGPRGRDGLLTAVEASLRELEETTDHRRAVIRAYATMEQVLGEHGLGRRPSEAPFEYLSRWMSALGLSRPTAVALTALYEWARFSPHPVDQEMEQVAVKALDALRRELAEDVP